MGNKITPFFQRGLLMPRPTPLPLRRVILQRAEQGQSATTIARSLGLVPRTVRQLLQRLRVHGKEAVAAAYPSRAYPHTPLPGPCRRGLANAPRPRHLGCWLDSRVLASAASPGSGAGGANAPALVPPCRTVAGAQRSSLRQPAATSTTAPRSLADGRGGPSRFARRHPGLLAPHRR
jgi:hypothetical protein